LDDCILVVRRLRFLVRGVDILALLVRRLVHRYRPRF
jgi:hypothetical protein